jgi:hypothetical protein
MRLCTTRPPAPRTWTVELRPRPQGPLLVCPQCSSVPETLHGRSARSAALAHLARHARRSLLPPYLRTCQCHERGCRWHPRHRGCTGPLLLVLSRERGGRLWRLADVCTACAGAMPDASVVPETTLIAAPRTTAPAPTPSPARSRRSRPTPTDWTDRALVRDMLSFLASSLAPCSPQARLLALQCALRSTLHGQVRIPAGLIRAMALPQAAAAWRELEEMRWVRQSARDSPVGSAQLTDPLIGAPGRKTRARAADWVLRTHRSRPARADTPAARLVALALAVHGAPGGAGGIAEIDQLARASGLSVPELLSVMRLLSATGAIGRWSLDPATDDLTWTMGPHVPAAPSSGQGC